MKNKMYLAAALTVLVSAIAYGAAITPDNKYKLNTYGQVNQETQLGTLVAQSDSVGTNNESTIQVTVGTHLKRVARVEYDAGKTTMGAVGTYDLGVTLPDRALVTRSWYEIVRQFASLSNTGRLFVGCGNGESTIVPIANLNGSSIGTVANGRQAGVSANINSDVLKVTGSAGVGCSLRATTAFNAHTAGKLVLFVEYVVTE